MTSPYWLVIDWTLHKKSYQNQIVTGFSLTKCIWNSATKILENGAKNIDHFIRAPVYRPVFAPRVLVASYYSIRADSTLAPSQLETSLQSNAVSHWLVANLEAALSMYPLEMGLFVLMSVMLCLAILDYFTISVHNHNGSTVKQRLSKNTMQYVYCETKVVNLKQCVKIDQY